MVYIYAAGLTASLCLAGFARRDGNYSEMRTHMLVALLFLSLSIDKVL